MLTNWMSGRRGKVVAGCMAATLLLQTACGTLFYPERRGQERGDLDPTVVILNGIGLLFFLIPGIVAFAVDFSTGAIYLPPDEASADNWRPGNEADPNHFVYVDPASLDAEKLSAVLSEHYEREIQITDEEFEQMKQGEAHFTPDGQIQPISLR